MPETQPRTPQDGNRIDLGNGRHLRTTEPHVVINGIAMVYEMAKAAASLLGKEDPRYYAALRDYNVVTEIMGNTTDIAGSAVLDCVPDRTDAREAIFKAITKYQLRVCNFLEEAGIPLAFVTVTLQTPDNSVVTPSLAIAAQLSRHGEAPRRTVGFTTPDGPEVLTALTRGFVFEIIPPEVPHGDRLRYLESAQLQGGMTEEGVAKNVNVPAGSVIAVDMPIVDIDKLRDPDRRHAADIFLLNPDGCMSPEQIGNSPDTDVDAFIIHWRKLLIKQQAQGAATATDGR